VQLNRRLKSHYSKTPPPKYSHVLIGQGPETGSTYLRDEIVKAEAIAKDARERLIEHYRVKALAPTNKRDVDLVYLKDGKLFTTARGAVKLLHIRRDVIAAALCARWLPGERLEGGGNENWEINLDDLENWIANYELNRDLADCRDPRLALPKRLRTPPRHEKKGGLNEPA